MSHVPRARLHVPWSLVAGALASCASLLASPGIATAMPLPGLNIADEYVVVREVASAREVVVARTDGTLLRVRIPTGTVAEGESGGVPVCGAAEATAALAKIVPVGTMVALLSATRFKQSSWPPFFATSDDTDDAVYAADGALYGDFGLESEELFGLTVAQTMLAEGWLRTGVALDAALADPSEIGLSTPVTAVYDGSERRARTARRGSWGLCLGAFRSAGPVIAIPTTWVVNARGRVRSIGGVPVYEATTKRVKRSGRAVRRTIFHRPGFDRFVKAWGPGAVTLLPGGCEVGWPARGLRISSDTGRLFPVAPRSEAACLRLPIQRIEADGTPTLLGALPMRSPYAELKKKIGPVKRYESTVMAGGRSSFMPSDGFLRVELDRRNRLDSLTLEVDS